jgi:hypothetical protein
MISKKLISLKNNNNSYYYYYYYKNLFSIYKVLL